MGLRERDRTEAAEESPAPRPGDRLRRLLALVAALGALIAFTTLARPDASPSSRLNIGDGDDRPGDADRAPERRPPAAEAQELVRPLDPSTLADVPANILALGQDEWTWPSTDGELLAVPDFSGDRGGGVRVLDARTFQPVATVSGDGLLTDFHGFTPDTDAVVVQVRRRDRQTLMRRPLDPQEAVTRVELPASVETTGLGAAGLADGRVALVVAERGAVEPAPGPPAVRVLVVDLLAERMMVDLPLPGLRADFFQAQRPDASLASPGFAWDEERDRLYVAHADSARVTVVDLAAGAVLAEAEIGAPVAAVGEEPVHRSRWASVSPDGSRLYVSGREFRPAQGRSRPYGLSVIDTASLSEVGRIERVADWVQLSPDGRWLLWAVEHFGSADGAGTNEPPRSALMDTRQIGLVTLLGGRGAFPLGFAQDSSHVYLQRVEAGRTVVAAFALPSLDETGQRRLPGNASFDPFGGLLREDTGAGTRIPGAQIG